MSNLTWTSVNDEQFGKRSPRTVGDIAHWVARPPLPRAWRRESAALPGESPRQASHHPARGVEEVLGLAALGHRREDLVPRRHADATAGLGEQAQQALRIDAALLGGSQHDLAVRDVDDGHA